MAEKITLTKQDRKKVWWRHQFLQGSWNYERMQNGGWCYSIIPAIKKLYSNKEDQIAALKRHMEFYNTHPYVSSPVMGVTLALEEEKANGENVDDTAIQGVKVGMMGPLAGVGVNSDEAVTGQVSKNAANFGCFRSFFSIKWKHFRTYLILRIMERNSFSIHVVYTRIWLQCRY